MFRLNVLRLKVAPLRERRSDIAVLASYFLANLAHEHGTPRKTLAPGVLQRLTEYDWPGNVRELHNVLHRMIVLSTGRQITLADLPDFPAPAPRATFDGETFGEARARTLALFEKGYIENMLRRTGGNVTLAARLAGKDRRVFGRLMRRYNVRRDLS